MNAELAYCLEHFIDDQIRSIDETIQDGKMKEEIECDKIEQKKKKFLVLRKKTHVNQGVHDEDAAAVQRFVSTFVEQRQQEKSAMSEELRQSRKRLEDLLQKKIIDCCNHIIRLNNLAVPTLHSSDFAIECELILERFQSQEIFKDNCEKLFAILEQTLQLNVFSNVQKWWNDNYEKYVRKIIRLNKSFTPGVGMNQCITLTRRDEIIRNANDVILKIKEDKVKKDEAYKTICKFVREIRSMDEETRKEVSENELITQLNNNETDFALNYAQKWLKKRDDKREKSKKEEETYDEMVKETKVKFQRERIGQESKKLALAGLLQRLAIGSTETERFKKKLEKTLEEQKGVDNLPVVTGDIGKPDVDDLPVSFRLLNANLKEWENNVNKIQEKFCSSLCQAFGIKDGSIKIKGIESGSVIIRAYVSPPHGKTVVDSLNGALTDSPQRISAVRQCLSTFDGQIESITLGEFGLEIDKKLMDPKWNRKYVHAANDPDGGEYWDKPIPRGGKPYYCPSGWFRFGIKVSENDQEFDKNWGNWWVGYHGTRSKYAVDILTSGLRMSSSGCYYEKDTLRLYLSPSIEYCAHRRYAEPWVKIEKDNKTKWFQLVFQCRVNPKCVKKIEAETLLALDHKNVQIDPNFNNKELEWILRGKDGVYHMKEDVICYGLMMRMSDVDPEQLPASKWWKYVYRSK